MKIVVSANNPHSYSAPNIWLLRVLPILRRLGVEVSVLFFSYKKQHGAISETLIANGIECQNIVASTTEQNIQDILGHLNAIQPDVFVTNVNVASCFSIPWVKSAGIQTVGIIRSDDIFHHDMINEFIHGQSRFRMNGVVCNSEYLLDFVRENSAEPILSMACPSGTPVPENKTSDYSAGEVLKLAYVGRFVEEQKCITETVNAFISAARQFENVEFDLYGSGGLWNDMKAKVDASGFSSRIRLHGQVDNFIMRKALLGSHAFVLLSEYEGVSTALCEAMASGLVPIVTNMRSGISEIVKANETGLIVEDRSTEFIQAVQYLLDNPNELNRMSENARELISREYSSEACAKKWFTFLEQTVRQEKTFNPISIPDKSDMKLPVPRINPIGILREDHREIDVWETVKKEEIPMKPKSDPFLNPSSEINNIDRFWVRKSLLESIRSTIPLLKGKFLDVGCGVMPYKSLIAAENSSVSEYLGMDIETDIYKAEVDLRWDGKTIPLPDNSVDSAMATEVLEHCPEPVIVLKEIRRVLKPGGVFFFTVPYIWPLHDAPWDFYRYTSFALDKMLDESGFSDVKIKALGGWNASLAQMIGLWLKRSPNSPEIKSQFAKQLMPLYEQLINNDDTPDPYAGDTMVTGWSGVAYVGKDEVEVEKAPIKASSDLKLAIFRSHKFNYSETFIEDHIAYISDDVEVIYGYPVCCFVKGKGSIFTVEETRKYNSLNEQGKKAFYTQVLASYLKKRGIRSVMTESGLMGAMVYQACEIAKIPYVVHFHGADLFVKDFQQKLGQDYKNIFRTASGLVAVSNYMKKTLVDMGADENKVLVNPCGVELPEVEVDPSQNDAVFVAVGRFVEKKAPHITIKAFSLLLKRFPNAKLYMAGDGDLWKRCKKQAEDLGIHKSVFFCGVCSRRMVRELLLQARAFVQHSVIASNGDQEGLPVGIMEAGALGIPVISTKHSGIPDAVKDGEYGYLVDENDVQGMANAMLDLAENPKRAKEMGQALKLHIVEGFIREVTIARLQKLIREVEENENPPVLLAGQPLSREELVLKQASVTDSIEALKYAMDAAEGEHVDIQEFFLIEAIGYDRANYSAYLEYAKILFSANRFTEAIICLKEAKRLGKLPENLEPMLQQFDQNKAMHDETLTVYRDRIGELGYGETPHKLRVLIFTNLLPPQEMGGYGRTIWEFADVLMQRGHEVRVLCADMPQYHKDPEAGYERVEKYVSRDLQLFGEWVNGASVTETDIEVIKQKCLHNHHRIMSEVESFQPDACMVGNIDFVGSSYLQAIADKNIPMLHRLGNAAPSYPADCVPNTNLFSMAGCSQWVNDNLVTQGYDFKRYAVVNPGSPLERYFRPFSPKLDSLRICFAGLLMPYKGSQVLMEALTLLKKTDVPFTCEFAGDSTNPDFIKHLKQVAQKGGISDKVKFTGFLSKDELSALYARSNVMVFPSVFEEPFGKSQIEAMAAGLCVVSSGTGGSKEIVQDGVNGLLFENKNSQSLAQQLFFLHKDKTAWSRLALQGQKEAFNFRTTNSVIKIENEFYEMLLSEDA